MMVNASKEFLSQNGGQRISFSGHRTRRLLLLFIIVYSFTTFCMKDQIVVSFNYAWQRIYQSVDFLEMEEYAPKRELRMIQVLFRHGHRSPFNIYPNDPYPKSYWIEGLGRLTMLGRVQHYAVGEYLRKRYSGFLKFHRKEVHCLSSGAERCTYGAYALLAGMYPPPPDKLIHENLNWHPIPVEYRPENQDKYLQSTPNCAAAENEKKAMFTRPEGAAFIAKFKHLYDFWSGKSGQNISNYDKAGGLYKTLLLQKTLNLTIPDWAEGTWEELKLQGDISYYYNFKSELTKRLRAGPVIGRMLDEMRRKIRNPEHEKKVYLYSGHGSNIAAILNAFNLFNMKIPPYSSFLTFELYRSELEQYSVRFLYTNSTAPEVGIPLPNVLVLPGCIEYCPFEYVEKYTRHLIPDDYKKECGSRTIRSRRRKRIK